MKKIALILIGAGQRGMAYTDYALKHPDLYSVEAVAEPVPDRRRAIQERHGLPDDLCFPDWKPLLEMPRLADAAVIATMDDLHFAPAMAAIAKGYDLLLEKPIAPTPQECAQISRAALAKGVRVQVCHVLRFTPFFMKIKALLDAGLVGEVMHINHTEGVGNVHQSHSFVRGNWRNSRETAPMILAKSCHDMDLLQWLLGRNCVKLTSFGSLSHFNREHMPLGAPQRCIDGCPWGETCYYNAVRLYLEDEKNLWFRTAATMKVLPTQADVEAALRFGPYGRCVYACDNDVVDHQVVNMEFEGGATAAFTMAAFNEGDRQIRIMGTKGELQARMKDEVLDFYDFSTRSHRAIPVSDGETASGHGGGDEGIVLAFHRLLNGAYEGASVSPVDVSARNHLLCFAAEQSRLEGGKLVDLTAYGRDYPLYD